MEILTIFLVAIGLSFDSFAASVSAGLVLKHIRFQDALKIASSLAFFQGAFPVLGWVIGKEVVEYIKEYDHWIAFVLLTALGIKMIVEGFKASETKNFNPLNPVVLLWMSVATSIDALFVGFSFAFIEIPILISAIIIAVVTGIISMLGILFGKKTGENLGKRMEITGGLILIGIGAKILIEHLFFP